jgi:hypothetical protein
MAHIIHYNNFLNFKIAHHKCDLVFTTNVMTNVMLFLPMIVVIQELFFHHSLKEK